MVCWNHLWALNKKISYWQFPSAQGSNTMPACWVLSECPGVLGGAATTVIIALGRCGLQAVDTWELHDASNMHATSRRIFQKAFISTGRYEKTSLCQQRAVLLLAGTQKWATTKQDCCARLCRKLVLFYIVLYRHFIGRNPKLQCTLSRGTTACSTMLLFHTSRTRQYQIAQPFMPISWPSLKAFSLTLLK